MTKVYQMAQKHCRKF